MILLLCLFPSLCAQWVFDKEEFDELKMRVAAEKEREGPAVSRGHSVHQSYADDDTPTHAKASAAAAAASVKSNTLAVPAAAPQQSRTPSLPDDDDTQPIDEDAHHDMPDFNDPTGRKAAAAAQGSNVTRATQGMQNISIVSPHAGGGSALSSPHTATPKLSPNPQHALSPHSEHTEGRFLVREDEDEEEEEDDGGDGGEQQQQQFDPQYGGEHYPGHESYAEGGSDPAAHTYQQQQQQQGQSGSRSADSGSGGGGGDVPAFHNDGYDEGDAGEQQGHTQHVGRFTCVSDEDEEEEEQ